MVNIIGLTMVRLQTNRYKCCWEINTKIIMRTWYRGSTSTICEILRSQGFGVGGRGRERSFFGHLQNTLQQIWVHSECTNYAGECRTQLHPQKINVSCKTQQVDQQHQVLKEQQAFRNISYEQSLVLSHHTLPW